MSLKRFVFNDLVNQTWEDSDLHEFFLLTRFAFCVFKGEKSNPVFKGIKFWSMPEKIIDNEVKTVWTKTQEILKLGQVYKSEISNKSNFPKSTENNVIHVRPKAKDAKDVDLLPFKDVKTGKQYYTKQCFWINARFILTIINNKH
jgi:hypothetical protein